MPLTLREKQSLFVRLVARLIDQATLLGYELTFGECYRTPEQAALNAEKGSGIRNSLHTQRLAIDLLLFIKGAYQTSTEAYRPLGVWWEGLSTADYTCAWGGRFNDGNHFSIAHNGVK